MKFYIETYGCTANLGNSRDAAAALSEMGHVPSSLEDADIVVVNTCAVTGKTERKILRRLRQLQQLQGDRLVIAGCLPAALPESVEKISCLLKIGVLGKHAAQEIVRLLGDYPPSFWSCASSNCVGSNFCEDLCGIVNIAEGCNGGCSYCVVRNARGRLVSRSPKDVIESVQRLVRSGIVEIQLTAQDAAAYGRDIGTSLPELLGVVSDMPGNYMIRVGMMNPDGVMPILGELVQAFMNPRVYKFIHLPVQSGSDKILESMGRMYTAANFLKIVDRFRSAFEDVSLTTDVITGFPGETDEDFRETMELIKSAEPNKVNVTKFSRRPGTPAARLYDMPDRIKKERSREMTRLWLEIARAKNRRYEGHILDALVTERGRGSTMKARSANYTGIVVDGAPELGDTLKVKVLESNPFYLTGSLHGINRDKALL